MLFINIITDKERWLPIIDDNVADIYEVSDHGRVRNKNSGYILSQSFQNDNYLAVSLQNQKGGNVKRRVARLVLKAFNPLDSFNGLEPNHLDGNHLNNKLNNLEWVTGEENRKHAKENKLYLNLLRGDSHPKAKYKETDTKRICILLSKGYKVNEIIEILHFTNNEKVRDYIRRVRDGKVHTHISSNYTFPQHKNEKEPFTSDTVHKICRLLEDGKNYAFILNELGISNNINNIAKLSRIATGTTFTDITAQYNFIKKPIYDRHSDECVNNICKLIDRGLNTNEIIDVLGLANIVSEKQFVRKIKRGEAFPHICKNYDFFKKLKQGSTTIENDEYYTIDIHL